MRRCLVLVVRWSMNEKERYAVRCFFLAVPQRSRPQVQEITHLLFLNISENRSLCTYCSNGPGARVSLFVTITTIDDYSPQAGQPCNKRYK